MNIMKVGSMWNDWKRKNAGFKALVLFLVRPNCSWSGCIVGNVGGGFCRVSLMNLMIQILVFKSQTCVKTDKMLLSRNNKTAF